MLDDPKPIIDHGEQFAAIIPGLPPGDIAEFGVYQGGSTVQLLTYGRKVFAFDTFQGLPVEDFRKEMDRENHPGKFAFDPTAMLTARGAECIKGRFHDTLPTFFSIPRNIVFAYVDCDFYESYKIVLEYLSKYLVQGGCIIQDDYRHCIGAHKAINEFIALGGWELDGDVIRRTRHGGRHP